MLAVCCTSVLLTTTTVHLYSPGAGAPSLASLAQASSEMRLAVDGLSRMSAATTAVLPIPTSSQSQPPRRGCPLTMPRAALSELCSTDTMKASDCFWYGRSLIVSTSPAGSGRSTG